MIVTSQNTKKMTGIASKTTKRLQTITLNHTQGISTCNFEMELPQYLLSLPANGIYS